MLTIWHDRDKPEAVATVNVHEARTAYSSRAVLLVVIVLLVVPAIFAGGGVDAARGIRLYNEGRFSESRDVLEGVVEKGEAGALELTVLGMACTMLGEFERAEEVLAKAEESDPFSPQLHVALGMLAFERGEYESAYGSFEFARRFAPDSPEVRRGMTASLANMAIDSYRADDLEEAERLLNAARNLDADNAQLVGMLIEVRRRLGKTESLPQLYRRLVEIQPENAQAFAELGVLLEERGDDAAALTAFREAELLDTDEPYPYLSLARYSREHGHAQPRIVSRLHSAITKAVQQSDRLRVQAVGVMQRAEGELGREEMESLQRLSQRSREPQRILEEAISLLERVHATHEEFGEDLRRLCEWYPYSLELGVALGRFLEARVRYAEAEEQWRRLLREFPTAPQPHLGLGRSLENRGATREARAAYLRARDIVPEEPDVYAALFRIFASEGELAALLQRYREFVTRERANPVLLDALADVEERLGYEEEAAAHRLRARELRERDQNS